MRVVLIYIRRSPHVIIRNRWYQNRTDKGARTYNVLTSLVNTLFLQKRNPVKELKKVYLLQRQQALRHPEHRSPTMFRA